MALRSDWSGELCPIRRSLDVLGDPWVLLIVRDVLHGPRRFDTLRENLGISEAVLSRRLASMIEAGLLERVEQPSESGAVLRGYGATEAAVELLPALQHLAAWAERHTPLPEGGAHMALIHLGCGGETESAEQCTACGARVSAEELVWDRPWREVSPPFAPSGTIS